MRYFVLIAIALAGCSESAAVRADRNYEFAKRNGNRDDRCAAARAMKQAYLEAGDPVGTNRGAISVQTDCVFA